MTGASSGIGFELARRFAANGFDLLLTAEPGGLDRAARELGQTGARVDAVAAGLATYDGVEALMAGRDHVVAGFKNKLQSAVGEGMELLAASNVRGVEPADGVASQMGVVTTRDAGDLDAFAEAFTAAIAQHRHWDRAAMKDLVPA